MDRGSVVFPFIVGCSRSGTTLLRLMLDAHPELAIPNESHFIPELAPRWQANPDSGKPPWRVFADDLVVHRRFAKWGVDEDELRRALADTQPASYSAAVRCVFALYARLHDKPRYGDKTPRYVECIPGVAGLFPEARFVHIVRDGRDVALSFLDMDFGPDTVAGAALLWSRRVRLGRRAGSRLGPDRYLEVRYESLAEAPEAQLAGITSFLGLRFDEAMLRYWESAEGTLRSLSAELSRHAHEPPTTGLRDWRRQMDPDQIIAFESVAGDTLREFGYPTTARRFSMMQAARARQAELRFRIRLARGRLARGGSRGTRPHSVEGSRP